MQGNPRCFLCRVFHVLPFARCSYCNLGRATDCPTLKAGFFLLSAWAITGVTTYRIGGPTCQAVFIMTGLATGMLLILINSHSNQKVRDRFRLNQLHQELAEQHEFLKDLAPLETLQACLDYIVKKTSSRLRCRRVSIMLPDRDKEWLYIAASCGLPEDIVRNTRIPFGERTSGRVFQQGRPIHVSDATMAQGRSDLPIDAQAFMCAPLLLSGMRWGNEHVGVLSVTEPIGRADFSLDDEFFFSNVCEAAAVAIHNQMAMAKIEESNMELLETLVKAIEARDEYTQGHSERVCEYALVIGRKLHLTKESLNYLRIAARLHDIGKIGIPDAILRKPGRLNEDEWHAVQQHPDIAIRMLSRASRIAPALEAIRHHHERLDGTGYPHGLREAEIPLLARAIGVADAFDAMTTARPYRQPMELANALAELRRGGNTQFDPGCVDALLEAIDTGEFPDIKPGLPARAS